MILWLKQQLIKKHKVIGTEYSYAFNDPQKIQVLGTRSPNLYVNHLWR